MADFDSLFSDASQLPLDVRIELIEALWDTVPERDVPQLSHEWKLEINRRSDEYDVGSVETTSWEQIKSDALSRLKKQS
jgi:putative addiction module component (TIGR02574 family)